MNHSANLFTAKWRSASNIAITKYWGKHGRQLPVNPLLSLTLKNSYTDLELNFSQKEEGDPEIALRFLFRGMRNEKFEPRITQYLSSIKEEFPFIIQNRIEIQSENSFPHSSGIASSASGMNASALTLTTTANTEKNGYYHSADSKEP